MEYSAFEEATVPICTFVLQNEKNNKKGKYIKLSDFRGEMEVQRIKTLEAIENPDCGYYYETSQDNFELIPGSPIAYWASEKIFAACSRSKNFEYYGETKAGMITGNNNLFVRLWHEIDILKFNSSSKNRIEAKKSICIGIMKIPRERLE